MFRRFRLIALALPVLAGCFDSETLNSPDLSNNNGLFTRFVSIGTSISAGFQSAGINDSTQQRSFQVLVAQQAGASFCVARPEQAWLSRTVHQQRDPGTRRRRRRDVMRAAADADSPQPGEPRGARTHRPRPVHERRDHRPAPTSGCRPSSSVARRRGTR